MLPTFHWLDEVDSTNQKARQLEEEGCPEGTVVVAKSQTAGRGRLGRNWESLEGGLYMSVVLRPLFRVELFGWLSLAAGISTLEALQNLTGKTEFQLKWPNDVLFDGMKLGGILGEATLGLNGAAIILGIGINLNQDPGKLPERPFFPATTVKAATGVTLAPAETARKIVDRLFHWYNCLEKQGPEPIRHRFIELSAHAGRWLEIQDGERQWVGKDCGLSEQGGLRLRVGPDMLHFLSAQVLQILNINPG